MAEWAAEKFGASVDEALVLSTGIIGEFMPMERVREGIELAAAQLDYSEAAFLAAADAILTTDRFRKVASRQIKISDREVCVAGMAKGAGMISPQLATMLAVIVTDAGLTPQQAQGLLVSAVDATFNCISVDGHMSTNDTVLLFANGAAVPSVEEGAIQSLDQAIREVCEELAKSIPADGEGASHLITIEVAGCATRADALKIARVVGNSPLVKTAIAGADPNWGRIVSAAGYAGVDFNPERLTLWVNGFLLYQNGRPQPFDPAAVSDAIRSQHTTFIRLELAEGNASARFWASDLTNEYVRINADYHT